MPNENTTQPGGAGGPEGRPARSGPTSNTSRGRKTEPKSQLLSDAEIADANGKLAEAFSMLGLYQDGNLVCPKCGNSKKKTVQFKTSKSSGVPYWKCFPCGENGSATKLMQEMTGKGFREVVNVLLGRDTSNKELNVKDVPKIEIAPAFEAVVDVEVYDFIRDFGSVPAAQRYWATWHLDPEVVRTSGSTMITDPSVIEHLLAAPLDSKEYKAAWARHVSVTRSLHTELKNRFGMERLMACGVLSEKGNFLINEDYCVIEPHEASTGHVVGMQFRPVGKAKQAVEAHKAWKRHWEREARERWPAEPALKASEAWERAAKEDRKAAGPKREYQTPFLSIRGAGTASLVGCGLRELAAREEPTTVYIVEGFKDLLAARTSGADAYGMPGTGNMPPPRACKILARHDVLIALDGDAAGEKGRKALLEHFSTTYQVMAKVPGTPKEGATDLLKVHPELVALLPGGFDVEGGDALTITHKGYLPEGVTPERFQALVAKVVGRDTHGVLLVEDGVKARLKAAMREGMDVTDVLVERVAHTGCKCPTCTAWRKSKPASPQECACPVCRAWREKHKPDPSCKCGSCTAWSARKATDQVVLQARKAAAQQ